MTSAFTKALQLVNKFHVPGKHIPSSWIIWNLTHDVVHKITCQVDVVVVASQRWRKCDLYTEIQRVLIWLKQEEVNGSDRPIYITPLTSEACAEPHSLFNTSLGPASPAAFRFPFGGGSRVLCRDGDRQHVLSSKQFACDILITTIFLARRGVRQSNFVAGCGLWSLKERKQGWEKAYYFFCLTEDD